jgi:hypothetical protein
MQWIVRQAGWIARGHSKSVAATVSLGLIVALVSFPAARAWLWSIPVVDLVVAVSVVATVILALLPRRASNLPSAALARGIVTPERLTAIAAAVAIFVTYASFRNQSRLAAETALNTEGQMLFEMEMTQPNLRCLYTSFAHDDPAACLRRIASNEADWSAASFYIEGVFWLLKKSEDDRKAWGSVYSDDINYWREYVNEDPTGLFAFYLLSFHGAGGAEKAMVETGVKIPDLCGKYRRVRSVLEQARANTRPEVRCR